MAALDGPPHSVSGTGWVSNIGQKAADFPQNMRYHLFIIGGPYTDEWWMRHLSMAVITAGFDNSIGDQGHSFLHDMDKGDWVIAYAKGYGVVGAGRVGGEETYQLLPTRELPPDFESPHRQFRSVAWTNYVETLADAVPFGELRLSFPLRHTDRN